MRACLLIGLLMAGGCSPASNSVRAKAVISGPQTARPGEIVVLDARGSTGQVCEWQIESCCQAAAMDEGWRIVLVASKSGKHKVGLKVWTVENHKLSVASAEYLVDIAADPDDPQPAPPGPTPTPTPHVPDGKWGFIRWAKQTAETQVSSASRAAEAKQLAGVFSSVASQISAGGLDSTIAIQAKTFEQIDSRLGSARPKWEPWVDAFMSKSRTTFRQDSPLAEIAEGWREVAQGLEAVQ